VIELDAETAADYKAMIENEVALGKFILDVNSRSAQQFVVVPKIQEVVLEDGQVQKKVVGYKIEAVETPFKEPLTPDLTKANLDMDDMRFCRSLLNVYFATKSHAERYQKEGDLCRSANLLVDLLNGETISSRARDFRGAILAKSSISVHEAKQRQWISEMDPEGGKKPFWKFW